MTTTQGLVQVQIYIFNICSFLYINFSSNDLQLRISRKLSGELYKNLQKYISMKPYVVEITKSRDILPRKQSITHQTSHMSKIEYLVASGPFFAHLSFDVEHKTLQLWGHLIRKTARKGGCLKSGTKKHKTYSIRTIAGTRFTPSSKQQKRRSITHKKVTRQAIERLKFFITAQKSNEGTCDGLKKRFL